MSALITVVLAVLLSSSASQSVDYLRWHAYPGDQVQYGVEGTDMRLAGFGCEKIGHLWMSVATDPELPPEMLVAGEVYRGELAERGDGPNLVVLLPFDAAAVRTIMEDRELNLVLGPYASSLPGGGSGVMRDLIEACRAPF